MVEAAVNGPFRGTAPFRSIALAALVAASGVAAFWPGLTSLVDAWAVPEYSHGPIIPVLSTFLFLRELRHVPPTDRPITDRWPGVLVLVLGLIASAFGILVRIPDIVTYGMIVWIAGVVLIGFGFRRGFLFWPAILHLVFMLPLPQFVYWQVSIYLQSVSSQIGVAVIQLFQIPVYLDGNVIDLGVYKLQVAEACSGLRYLFPLLSFSYVFSVLYTGPVWHKAILLLSAAPITVLMNSFRIGMIGVLVNSFGIDQAEGFLHAFEGWLIFLACVMILFAITWVLKRMTGDRRPLSETLDIEFEGLLEQAARVRRVVPSPALAAGVALTLGMATAFAVASTPERATVAREPLVLFPLQVSGWTGATQRLDRSIEAVLAADDYFLATYAKPGAQPVDLFMAYYNRQTEGGGIHSPEVCIPAGGWEVSEWRPTEIVLEGGERFAANRAIIQKGLSRQIVYYWFEQRGERMVSDYAVKFATVRDALLSGREDGGIVRVITPIAPNESEAAADARLRDFLGGVSPLLPRFMPG